MQQIINKTKLIRKYLTFIISIMLLVAMYTNARSDIGPTPSLLMNGKFDATSVDVRKYIAKQVLNEINLLNDKIPNPSPEELKWIKKEYDASKDVIISKRLEDLLASTEFQKKQLKYHVKKMRMLLIKIIKSPNISIEMKKWAQLSYLMLDSYKVDRAINILLKRNKLPSSISHEFNGIANPGSFHDFNTYYHAEGRGIIRYILVPYFSAPTKSR